MAGEHLYPVRIYYEDTDAGGVVYHANYLRFFERARTHMLELAGIDHLGAVARGEGAYVVAAADLRYLAPTRLGDVLTVASTVEDVRAAAVVVHQRVIRDAQVIVTGRLTIAFVSPEGRPRRQPAHWIRAIAATMEG